MELKETKRYSSSVEVKKATASQRDNSDRQAIYNLIYPLEESAADQHSDTKNSEKDEGNPTLVSVSTLEWLKTWRSLEIS